MDLETMTGDEMREFVRWWAGKIAHDAYLERHPFEEDEAWAWAARKWRSYQEQALDRVALFFAIKEKEEEKKGRGASVPPSRPVTRPASRRRPGGSD